jgi:hypothetical protein
MISPDFLKHMTLRDAVSGESNVEIPKYLSPACVPAISIRRPGHLAHGKTARDFPW